MTISDEQRAFGAATCRWLEIRQQWDHGRLTASLGIPNQLQTDLLHSNLIYRLLAGKEPLAKPPPLRHSGPWYGLIDNGSELIPERFAQELGPSNSILTETELLLEGALWRIDSHYRANGGPAWRARYAVPKRQGDELAPSPWRASIEYAGMHSFGSGLTREASDALRRRQPGTHGNLTPEELPSGRPATLPYWQPCYRVTILE